MLHGASSVSSSTLSPWWLLALLTGAAWSATWLLRRAARARALAAVRRFTPVVLVSIWAPVAFALQRKLAPEGSAHGFVGASLLVVIFVAALPWLRNLFHGVALVLEGRYRLGDDLRVGPNEGRVVAMGARAIVLRAHDGTEISIPYASFAECTVVRLNLALRDAPCELVLMAPRDVDLDTAVELARVAAALSPYAAPRSEPRAFAVTDGLATEARVRLQGFVFDREHEPLYRSDVGARFLRMAADRACVRSASA